MQTSVHRLWILTETVAVQVEERWGRKKGGEDGGRDQRHRADADHSEKTRNNGIRKGGRARTEGNDNGAEPLQSMLQCSIAALKGENNTSNPTGM